MSPIHFVVCRNRTPSPYVGHGPYLYFSGLSLRRVSESLSCFVKRNHASAWNRIQKYKPKRVCPRRKKTSGFIIDETLIKAGSMSVWLRVVAIGPKDGQTLALSTSKERNMFAAEACLGIDQDLRKASGFNRRWRMASTSL
jgi:transposase-like protein